MTQIPLVFHYLGNPLPNYAFPALSEAVREWPGRVILIHDQIVRKKLSGVEIVSPHGWYDRASFEGWIASTKMPLGFREGFWFHAVERFFMLEQWASTFSIEKFLHCELDVAIYRSSTLVPVLERLPQKIYYPRASQTHAGANWLFCNSGSAMSKLTDFFIDRAGHEFEMAILADFLDEYPEFAEAAPSHYTIELAADSDNLEAWTKLTDWGGIVDVHPIGTWLLGRDPRNIKTFFNFNRHYYEGVGSVFLAKLRYHFDRSSRGITVGTEKTGQFGAYAIHVHSKEVRHAYSSTTLRIMTFLCTLPFPVPVSVGNFRVAFSRLLKKITDPVYRILIEKK